MRSMAASAIFLMGTCSASAGDAAPDGDNRHPEAVGIDVKRGDEWNYESRDDLTGETKYVISVVVSDVAGDEIDTRIKARSLSTNIESVGVSVFDKTWRKKEDNGNIYKINQENWGIPNSIKIGNDWTYLYTQTTSNARLKINWAGHGEGRSRNSKRSYIRCG